MADRSMKLPNLALHLAGVLPEVQTPRSVVPLRHKVAYTVASLLVYLVGSQLPLYGAHFPSAADPWYWVDMPNCNYVMADGIMPLVLSEGLLHLLLQREVLRVNNREDRMLLNRMQKLLAILFAAYISILRALVSTILGELTIGQTILIVPQHFFGSVIIIYLDDLLKKGYGFLSSITLFSVTDICASILWKSFSPCIIKLYGGQHGDQQWEGAVSSSVVHRFLTYGKDKFSSMNKASGSQGFPDMARVIATLAFFLLVLSLQGFHSVLPLRSSEEPSIQMNYDIKLSYLSFAPLLFQDALAVLLYFISKMLYVKFGENKVVNLLGKWKKSKYFGQPVLVSSLAYYITTPPTLADVGRYPFHTLVYALWQLLECGLTSSSFFYVCSHSKLYVARLLGERRNVMVAQPDPVPLRRWRCYVVKAAFLVGLCIGALKLLAGLAGVVGSGTGIMLCVTVLHSCFEETRGRPAGAFGF